MSQMMSAAKVAIPFALLILGNVVYAAQPGDCGYYRNSVGHQVPRPCGDARSEQVPPGATAICRDGTYSYSEHPYSGGTCSHHGGVQKHLR